MTLFKLPIQVPQASDLKVTQPFGPTQNTLEPKGPNGEPHFHYGVDIVCGDDHATFGATLRCPFTDAKIINEYAQPQGSRDTPFIELEYISPSGGYFTAILAHCSFENVPGDYTFGRYVGSIGNIGLVSPKPTLADPYAGAHLHLGLMLDDVWVNPLEYFDIQDPFIGPGPTQADQLPATHWLIKQILAFVKGMV